MWVQLSLSGCLWFFFFTVCTDKSKKKKNYTRLLPYNVLIFFLRDTLSTRSHVCPICECQVCAGDGPGCIIRSFFFFLPAPLLPFVSRSLARLAPLSNRPHTRCQREIATSVCPVQCVMCDNKWRMCSRASGFRVPLEDTYYCYRLSGIVIISWSRRDGSLCVIVPLPPPKKKKKKKTLKRSPPNITNKEREENTLKITLALFQRSSPHPSSHPRPATPPPPPSILASFCIAAALCRPFFCLSIKCSLLLSRPLFLVPRHSIFLRDTLCPHPLSLAAII